MCASLTAILSHNVWTGCNNKQTVLPLSHSLGLGGLLQGDPTLGALLFGFKLQNSQGGGPTAHHIFCLLLL